MIQDAIKAGLPLVALKTRDTVNFETVIQHMTGKSPQKLASTEVAPNSGDVYYFNAKGKQVPSARTMYHRFAKANATLIILNGDKPIDETFEAGELETPKTLIHEALMTAFKSSETPKEDTEAFVSTLLPALGGLTLKEVAEVLRLTQVREETVSSRTITQTRGLLVPNLSGLTQINTDLPVYIPNAEWGAFVASQKPFFVNEGIDPRLVPRGVLADGDPGTGKTQGAKFLANAWGVPLYRIAADFQSKWVGESESNLQRILAQAGQEEPCILLIDEVEKLFSQNSISSGGGGSMSKTMSLLLWFMQESRKRVFVMMTCNNKSIIPPELYREGRIAGTITFVGLLHDEAQSFVTEILKSFKVDNADVAKAASYAVTKQFHDAKTVGKDRVPHSAINEAVVAVIKHSIAGTLVIEAEPKPLTGDMTVLDLTPKK